MTYVCPRCGAYSEHPINGAVGYCGACRDWTSAETAAPAIARVAEATARRVIERTLADKSERLRDARLYAAKMTRDQDAAVRRSGADLLQILDGDATSEEG